MQHKTVYLIDTENMGYEWSEYTMSAKSGDIIVFFYTDNSPTMPFSELDDLTYRKIKLYYARCATGTNALDFQLATELGRLVASYPEWSYIIISKDKGYEAIVNYWACKNISILRVGTAIPVKKSEITVTDSTISTEQESKPISRYDIARTAYRDMLKNRLTESQLNVFIPILINAMSYRTPMERMNHAHSMVQLRGKTWTKIYGNIKDIVKQIANNGPFLT